MEIKIGTVMAAALVALVAVGAQADDFGTGKNRFSIDFVDIGNAGNAADSTGYGAVADNYKMGRFEVTIDQFAKARAADSRIGDGDEGYWNDRKRTAGTGCPATRVSAYEAMKFANFLTTGDAYTGAYQFNRSGTLVAVDRDAAVSTCGTVYVLPTEDEWYKAAYYKPVNDGSYSLYASGLDTVPTHGTARGWNYCNDGFVNGPPNYMWKTGSGGKEQNGTYDMNGNVLEWNESAGDGTLNNLAENRVLRGGAVNDDEIYLRSSNRDDDDPTSEDGGVGFRVAAIPVLFQQMGES